MRLCPTAPHPPSPTSLLSVPKMLGNTPGLPFTWVVALLSPPTSCLPLPWWPRPSLSPVPVTWDFEGPRWPLQGTAGKAGDAAAASGHSQGVGD